MAAKQRAAEEMHCQQTDTGQAELSVGDLAAAMTGLEPVEVIMSTSQHKNHKIRPC